MVAGGQEGGAGRPVAPPVRRQLQHWLRGDHALVEFLLAITIAAGHLDGDVRPRRPTRQRGTRPPGASAPSSLAGIVVPVYFVRYWLRKRRRDTAVARVQRRRRIAPARYRRRMTGNLLVFLGAALASAVEMVEALTIVLALGVTRGWRAPLQGAAAALVVLAVLVAALGPALEAVPIDVLRLVVGALLLVFGLQWLRKAILRASGLKALHDEDAAFAAEVAAAAGGRPQPRPATGTPS